MIPYYDKNGITIYCGENDKVMRQVIGDDTIDLTVTSPPYDLVDEDMITHCDKGLRDYQGYSWDFVTVAKELWRVTAKGGVVVWVVGDATVNGSETGSSFRQALYFKKVGFNLHDTMIWDKEEYAFPNHTRYESVFEFMFVLAKGSISTFNPIQRDNEKSKGRKHIGTDRNIDGTTRECYTKPIKETSNLHNIWRVLPQKSRKITNHPAIFPEALAHNHIVSWSNPGNLILDPFLGSGTTLKMAQQLGRRGVGIEVSEDYCKIAVERLKQPSFFSIPNKPKETESKQLELI